MNGAAQWLIHTLMNFSNQNGWVRKRQNKQVDEPGGHSITFEPSDKRRYSSLALESTPS